MPESFSSLPSIFGYLVLRIKRRKTQLKTSSWTKSLFTYRRASIKILFIAAQQDLYRPSTRAMYHDHLSWFLSTSRQGNKAEDKKKLISISQNKVICLKCNCMELNRESVKRSSFQHTNFSTLPFFFEFLLRLITISIDSLWVLGDALLHDFLPS